MAQVRLNCLCYLQVCGPWPDPYTFDHPDRRLIFVEVFALEDLAPEPFLDRDIRKLATDRGYALPFDVGLEYALGCNTPAAAPQCRCGSTSNFSFPGEVSFRYFARQRTGHGPHSLVKMLDVIKKGFLISGVTTYIRFPDQFNFDYTDYGVLCDSRKRGAGHSICTTRASIWCVPTVLRLGTSPAPLPTIWPRRSSTSTRFTASEGHSNHNLECCFHLLPHHPWSSMVIHGALSSD